jgi:hypothetical protein
MAELSKQEIGEHLYLNAVAAAAGQGRAFRAIADGGIRQLLDQAADEILNPSRLGSESVLYSQKTFDERLSEADAAVQSLVQAMVLQAQSVPGYPTNVLGERTLTAALSMSSFCPCWPFC